MSILPLAVGLALSCLAAATEDRSKTIGSDSITKHNALISAVTKNNVASLHNITYIDKAENMLRTPNIKKYYDEVEKQKKKKKAKKAPKRTIQKIIKKNRAKLRKLYFSQKASVTTAPPKVDLDKNYGQDEKQWRDEPSTTQVNQKKKSRKYSPRVAGYHMPFQKLKSMKDKRFKRGGLSRELYILKDLDEIEFLSKEGDEDVVKAHVKSFW